MYYGYRLILEFMQKIISIPLYKAKIWMKSFVLKFYTYNFKLLQLFHEKVVFFSF